MTGGYIFTLCVSPQLGGSLTLDGVGGVPTREGSQVSDFLGGGPRSQIFRGGGYPVSVKGKIFDTRLGLIHVQTGKKFLSRDPPPSSKGKNCWHQIWLDTCSDWEKIFLSRDPPPPSKGKNFKHQIWLDTCSDWGKKFLSRDPPPPE